MSDYFYSLVFLLADAAFSDADAYEGLPNGQILSLLPNIEDEENQ